jgi:hypothetical protein
MAAEGATASAPAEGGVERQRGGAEQEGADRGNGRWSARNVRPRESAATSAAGQLDPSPGRVEPHQHDCPPRVLSQPRTGHAEPPLRRPAHWPGVRHSPTRGCWLLGPRRPCSPAPIGPSVATRKIGSVIATPERHPEVLALTCQVGPHSTEMLVKACRIGQPFDLRAFGGASLRRARERAMSRWLSRGRREDRQDRAFCRWKSSHVEQRIRAAETSTLSSPRACGAWSSRDQLAVRRHGGGTPKI